MVAVIYVCILSLRRFIKITIKEEKEISCWHILILNRETYELYYVNVQTQALEQEKVQIEGDTTEEKIESMLKELKKNPEDVEVKSTFPKKIKVEKWIR